MVTGVVTSSATVVAERIGLGRDAHSRNLLPRRRGAATLAAIVFIAGGCSNDPASAPSNTTSTVALFQESAATRGITGDHAPFKLYLTPSMNGGGAVEDLDRDGDLDIYLTKYNQPNELWLNNGSGSFARPASPTGLEVEGASGTPLFADFDGDGDLDAFVTPTNYGRPYLLMSEGKAWIDQTAERGIALRSRELSGENGSFAYGAHAMDIDHDTDLDLLIGEWGLVESVHHRRDTHRAYLFRNDGDGRFVDDTTNSGLDVLRQSAIFGFADLDVDGDGWEDLLISGDFGSSMVLRSQEGKRFVDITRDLLPEVSTAEGAVPSNTNERVYNAMGSTLADLDGDGSLDWIVSAIGSDTDDATVGGCLDAVQMDNAIDAGLVIRCTGNRAYAFDGTGAVTDMSVEFGIRDGGWGWGIVAADLNVDGQTDVALTNGYVAQYQPNVTPPTVIVDGESRDATELPVYRNAVADTNRLWLSEGSGGSDAPNETADRPLRDVAVPNGFGSADQGRALVPADIDRDGDLDLMQVNDGAAPPELFINSTNPPDERWITIRVAPRPDVPPGCIGCVVRITDVDGRQYVQKISGSGSFSSDTPNEATFGLATASPNVTVNVVAPGGITFDSKQETGGVRIVGNG